MKFNRKVVGIGMLFFAGAAMVIFAAASPTAQNALTSPISKAKAAAASANKAADQAPAVVGTTQDANPANLEGTTVVSSSSDESSDSDDDDPYADQKQDAKTDVQFVLTKDANTGLLTIDAPGEDVRTIVSKVADLYNLNILIPPSLTGTTTLKFRDVSWKQLFDVMLPGVGCGYMEDKNIVLIKSKDEISAEPVQTTVFPLNYALATDLVTSITPLIDAPSGGKIQVDKRSNSLIITERPSKFNAIKDIIDRLDHQAPEVMIETKFIDIDDTDFKNLGINWSSLNAYKLSMGGGTGDLPAYTRTWTRENTAGGPYMTTLANTAVFNAPEFDVILNALNTLSGTHLISNPTVVALSNTEATINVGEEYPIPDYTYNQQQGSFEISGFEYKDIGVNLKVTPQINPEGYITLTINPEVSDSDSSVTFGGASGTAIPIITTRKSSNTVCVRDGNTIAIGGLIETRKVLNETKVPVLGDLPGVGNIFGGSQNNQTEKRNLIVFITVRIVSSDGARGPSTLPLRQMNEMGLSSKDMSGYSLTPDEEALLKKIALKRDEAVHKEQMKALKKEDENEQKVIAPPPPPTGGVDNLDSRAH